MCVFAYGEVQGPILPCPHRLHLSISLIWLPRPRSRIMPAKTASKAAPKKAAAKPKAVKKAKAAPKKAKKAAPKKAKKAAKPKAAKA